MPLIDQNGFLEGVIYDWVDATRGTHKVNFEIAERINCICHEFLSNRRIQGSDKKAFVLFLIFARMLELYQGIILLNMRGMTGASSVVFRSYVEAHFHFDAISKDDEYLEQYIDRFHIQRLSVAKALSSSKDESLAGLRALFSADKLNELRDLERKSFAKARSVREVAELGGNAGTYFTAYSFLSNDIHTNSASLEKYLDGDSSSAAKSIRYGPEDNEIVRQLGLAGLVLLASYERLAGLFAAEVDARKEDLEAHLKSLLKVETA